DYYCSSYAGNNNWVF
nr:immunoglobulin light chain junction region [Macaca mulatta]MOX11508.1 immunoglobulin light chain junction region [Macaca mulatta]MOX11524.1 immunoglobulin light chain junction region [Macaca mulatta]MOX11609.1 immunoglobulin light chain junction region [Macaca mulatta]MOX11678.1 immunoglobulin light chain junction region [Macaca mulatta]